VSGKNDRLCLMIRKRGVGGPGENASFFRFCLAPDPIGVQADLPYSEGEYDAYAPLVLSAFQRGATDKEIAALLASIARTEIGFSSRGREPG
jgi:hypothetical protein